MTVGTKPSPRLAQILSDFAGLQRRLGRVVGRRWFSCLFDYPPALNRGRYSIGRVLATRDSGAMSLTSHIPCGFH
jgi:hypothetical protein